MLLNSAMDIVRSDLGGWQGDRRWEGLKHRVPTSIYLEIPC